MSRLRSDSNQRVRSSHPDKSKVVSVHWWEWFHTRWVGWREYRGGSVDDRAVWWADCGGREGATDCGVSGTGGLDTGRLGWIGWVQVFRCARRSAEVAARWRGLSEFGGVENDRGWNSWGLKQLRAVRVGHTVNQHRSKHSTKGSWLPIGEKHSSSTRHFSTSYLSPRSRTPSAKQNRNQPQNSKV